MFFVFAEQDADIKCCQRLKDSHSVNQQKVGVAISNIVIRAIPFDCENMNNPLYG